MYVLMSQETLVRGIRAFLRKHGVNLGGFDSQVEIISTTTFKHYSLHVGDMKDSVVAVGDKSRAKSGS